MGPMRNQSGAASVIPHMGVGARSHSAPTAESRRARLPLRDLQCDARVRTVARVKRGQDLKSFLCLTPGLPVWRGRAVPARRGHCPPESWARARRLSEDFLHKNRRAPWEPSIPRGPSGSRTKRRPADIPAPLQVSRRETLSTGQDATSHRNGKSRGKADKRQTRVEPMFCGCEMIARGGLRSGPHGVRRFTGASRSLVCTQTVRAGPGRTRCPRGPRGYHLRWVSTRRSISALPGARD